MCVCVCFTREYHESYVLRSSRDGEISHSDHKGNTTTPCQFWSHFIDALLSPVFVSVQSIGTLQKQAEGLCEILNTKPSQTTLEVHRAVFGCNGQSDAPSPPVRGPARSRQPIKRALEEAAATEYYKKQHYPAAEGEPE